MCDLKKSIQYMKGIGPKKGMYLEKIGVTNIEDFLYTFPREYENREKIKKIIDTENDEKVTIKATICGKIQERVVRRGLRLSKVMVKDDTGSAYAVFYNSPYLKKVLKVGDEIYLYGKIKRNSKEVQILHPDYRMDENEEGSGILPLYNLTHGLTQKDMQKLGRQVLDLYSECIKEFLPVDTQKRNRLCDLTYAMKNIHFPSSKKDMQIAKFRLIFEELLVLQLGLSMIKNNLNNNNKGIQFNKLKDNHAVDLLIGSLPFELTNAQRRVLKEIEIDMESDKVMNRLVQGDVGSGKTILAIISLYKAILNGYQGVLMAPTEILAEQHLSSAKELLEPLGVKIELLSGSVRKKKKEEILKNLETGEIDIVIGTHALIQENVHFKNLGLVITDEQHRFGVMQRSTLSGKGKNPDVLVMTATPIPRTLALILYGDLDISIIDELPPGRKIIKTDCVDEKKRERVYNFIKKEINTGRQVYIVVPLVEESENIDAKSAYDVYEELKMDYLKEFEIGLLHGKMKSYEKDEVMGNFKAGKIQVLVSTTVIEVGVNVPNASVMIVENSERFGLAQLHQLRGRVGRGQYQSYCILINCGKSALSKKRMKIMEETNNGFLIAEKDLELRGPGEFFGTRQHGLPQLKIANLFKHMKILKDVQKEAEILIKDDKMLILEKNMLLKNKIIDTFGSHIEHLSL